MLPLSPPTGCSLAEDLGALNPFLDRRLKETEVEYDEYKEYNGLGTAEDREVLKKAEALYAKSYGLQEAASYLARTCTNRLSGNRENEAWREVASPSADELATLNQKCDDMEARRAKFASLHDKTRVKFRALVAEAPWSVAEWAVAVRFDNPRASVPGLLLG